MFINEPRSGKDLTAKKVFELLKVKYAEQMGYGVPNLDPSSAEGQMLQAELESMQEVMDEAEPLINDASKTFKGFLPAVFAYRVAERFDRKVGGVAYLKLTAPAELVRHQANMPDPWEDDMIKKKFQSVSWKKGELVEGEAQLGGRKAYRLLVPEYYENTCSPVTVNPKAPPTSPAAKRKAVSSAIWEAPSAPRST